MSCTCEHSWRISAVFKHGSSHEQRFEERGRWHRTSCPLYLINEDDIDKALGNVLAATRALGDLLRRYGEQEAQGKEPLVPGERRTPSPELAAFGEEMLRAGRSDAENGEPRG